MSTYIKIENTWTPINRIFKKINGEWVLQNDIISALGDMIYVYGGNTISKLLYIIFNQNQYTGKSFLLTSTYDGNTVYPSWTIISGSQYVTINSNGKVTINEGVTNQSIEIQASYNGETDNKTITVSYDNQLTIESADTISGTSGNVIARYNSTVVTPTWSITSGNQYATINSSGEITIISSGTITVYASYNNYSATKNITLVYDSSTSTEVEVNDDGSTTTTVTIVTENQDGTTTETSVITTTNEDGSTSNTESETTINQDGSSSTTSTTSNSDGTSSSTTSSTTAPDANGSTVSTSSTVHYDENGDTTGSSANTTTNNSDGSSSSTTTNYDENGDPTDKVNEDIDSSGNEKTQNIEYNSNGDEVVVGYTVDTSNNSDTGTLDFGGSSEDAINTGFVPIDVNVEHNGFDMMIYFRSTYAEQKTIAQGGDTDNQWTILDMTPDDPSNNWANNQGLVIRWQSGDKNKIYVQLRTASTNDKPYVAGTTVNGIANCFKFGLRYYDGKLVLRNMLTNSNIRSINSNAFSIDMSNVRVTVGSAWDGINQCQFRYSVMDLYDFYINKIDHWFDY